MKFENIVSVFIGIVIGSSLCYMSYPYIDKTSEQFAKIVVGKQKEVVYNLVKQDYPLGTFEHEVKRTQ